MNSLKLITALFITTLSITGCGSLLDYDVIDERYLNGNGVRVDLLRDEQDIMTYNGAPQQNTTTHSSRDGSVEVYSLDGVQTQDYAAAPRLASPVLRRSSVNQDAREKAFTPEAGLEIFPLDKEMNQALRLPR